MGGLLVVGGVALAIALLPEEIVAAAAAGAGVAARAVGRVAVKALKKAATKTKNAVKAHKIEPPKIDPKLAAENKVVAEKIANGHAYDKHILGQPHGRGPNRQVPREFPGAMRTRKQFQDHIEKVMNDPKAPSKALPPNRTAYWDDEYGATIIKHPSSKDGGTMFQPKNGRNYFDRL